MPNSSKSLVLSLRNAYEALAVSAPTVIDAARGRLTTKVCDERLERFAANVMKNLGVAVTVRGRENLERASGPGAESGGAPRAYVVMSNHQSHYDVPVLYYVLGGNLRMVAKKELFALPVFGRAIRDAGMIEVDRGNRTRAIRSLGGAKVALEAGTNIWIAPEGTRSPSGELLPFKKGGFVLATEVEAPLLPVTITGTRQALPANALFSRAGGEVLVTIHPPVETKALLDSGEKKRVVRDRLMDDVRRAIASAM